MSDLAACSAWGPLLAPLGVTLAETAVIVIDHGSRRTASNDQLQAVAELFQRALALPVVEPAHMELAEPSLAAAFDRCVARGARLVLVHPYFLAPGRHWSEDIPALAAEAAGRHPGVRWLVTAPLGLHPLMARIMSERITDCLALAAGGEGACEACGDGAPRCRLPRG